MDKPLTILGIDPDTSHCGLALATKSRVLEVCCVKPRASKTDDMSAMRMIRALPAVLDTLLPKADAVVVEGQQIYTGSKVSPESILAIAYVTGAIVAAVELIDPDKTILVPKPARWKGQTPKNIQQARTMCHYDLKYELSASGYAYPSGCARAAMIRGYGRLNKGDWKHVSDALGLSLWGIRHLEEVEAKAGG